MISLEERKLLTDIKDAASSRIIVDLRNRISHAYDSINDTIIWKIIMKDIPVLLTEVQQLLAQE